MKKIFTLISVVMLFAACDSTENKTSTEATSDENNCPLALVDSSLKVTWTAFKTTERIGVSGTFDIVAVNDVQAAETVAEALQKASFEIPVSGVNSANPDRDKKIFGHFFSTMENTAMLAGRVIETGADSWKIGVVMNSVRDTLNFDFKQEGDDVMLSTTMELAKWNALASVDSLNQVCYDLHKGADGVSKLWPDVKIEISATLVPDCK